MRWYTQSRPLAAHREHRGVRLSQRRLPRTQALQLFWRDAAAAAAAARSSLGELRRLLKESMSETVMCTSSSSRAWERDG